MAYRNTFLRQMVGLGFPNESNEDEKKHCHVRDPECPSSEVLEKTVCLFHDESTFQANNDQATLWENKGTNVIRPKSRQSGIMVSDFICERDGYLALTDEEYESAKQNDPSIRKHTRQFLEYGEAKEGYWTAEKFMDQIKQAVKIAKAK